MTLPKVEEKFMQQIIRHVEISYRGKLIGLSNLQSNTCTLNFWSCFGDQVTLEPNARFLKCRRSTMHVNECSKATCCIVDE